MIICAFKLEEAEVDGKEDRSIVMSITAAIPILGGRVLRAAESDRSATLRPKKESEKAVPLPFRRPPIGNGPP